MNEKLEAIFELPLKTQLAVLIGTSATILLSYYFMFHLPVSEQIAEKQEAIEQLELKIAEKKGVVANLSKFESEVERLDIELAKALKELPDKKGIEQLLSRISDRVRNAGLEINLFQPLPEQKKDYYAEVPVQIEVNGTYHEVATFFDEVSRLARIVNLTEFTLAQPVEKDEEIALRTSVVATSFRFLEESERPSKKEKKKSKRRRRR